MIATDHERQRPVERAAHLLLVSIGNSRVALATYSDQGRGDIRHVPIQPVEGVTRALNQAWQSLPDGTTRAVVVGSVCPPALEEVYAYAEQAGIRPFLIVGHHLPPPMDADVPEPEKVGMDRLLAAAGAFAKVKTACVVADFGTAVTIDLVADNGVFLGGTILPGLALAARALHEHTARLPLVEMGTTTEVLGKDTASAIRNGIFAMMTGALREIVEHYATDIGKWPPLVVTGGDAAAIAAGCDFIDRVMPDLIFDGLVLAYERSLVEPS